MLHGIWCTPELVKAVELGYKVCKIHEVWHFPNRQRGLFADYVKKWLKIKQESAGYPSWAQTEEQKQTYRYNYTAHEGINLDPTRSNPIQPDPKELRQEGHGQTNAELLLGRIR